MQILIIKQCDPDLSSARRNVMTATKAAVQLRKEELKKDASTDKMSFSDSDSESGPLYSSTGKADLKHGRLGHGMHSSSTNKFNYYERGTQTIWALCKVSIWAKLLGAHQIF